MENGVGLLDALIQYLQGFLRWEDEQFNFAPLSLTSSASYILPAGSSSRDRRLSPYLTGPN